MRQTLRSGSPRAYAAVMAGLWIDLWATLGRLDRAAADPDLLLEDEQALPVLQYELHRAVELVAGVVPPEQAEAVHDELVASLAEARELTSDIAAALEHGGPEAAAPLVWEWRGALFRVRFARLRLERPRPEPPSETSHAEPRPAKTAPALAAATIGGGSAFVLVAALLGVWPLLALTLAATVGAALLLRP